jgi:hypothetical protein
VALVMDSNCGRNIAVAVVFASPLHRNCGVIFNHMYGRIVTASNDFNHVRSKSSCQELNFRTPNPNLLQV